MGKIARESFFFLPPDKAMLSAVSEVSDILLDAGYGTERLRKYNRKTDFLLVAYVFSHDYIVVTCEKATTPHPGVNPALKIPNVCKIVDVKCMSPYEMLEQERPRSIHDEAEHST